MMARSASSVWPSAWAMVQRSRTIWAWRAALAEVSVARDVDGWRPAGDHRVVWRGRDARGRDVALVRTAVALTDERARRTALIILARARTLQPFLLFINRLQIGLELVDMLALCDRQCIQMGELFLNDLEVAQYLCRQSFCNCGLLVDLVN